MHTTHDYNDKTPEKNTRLDIRKTSTNGTVKAARLKDNAKKDPYPWLVGNDPRRHMTDIKYLKAQ